MVSPGFVSHAENIVGGSNDDGCYFAIVYSLSAVFQYQDHCTF